MPRCFQLLRNGEPVALATIDQEMCLHFGEPCDEKRYFREWYNFIGYDLASGQSFDEIRATYRKPEYADLDLVPVVDWIETNFTPKNWWEPKTPRAPRADRSD